MHAVAPATPTPSADAISSAASAASATTTLPATAPPAAVTATAAVTTPSGHNQYRLLVTAESLDQHRRRGCFKECA